MTWQDKLINLIVSFTALHDQIDRFSGPKLFILVSTVMTWTSSKPLDPVSELLFCPWHQVSSKEHLFTVEHLFWVTGRSGASVHRWDLLDQTRSSQLPAAHRPGEEGGRIRQKCAFVFQLSSFLCSSRCVWLSGVLWVLLPEPSPARHICGGVRTAVRDGRADLSLLLQGEHKHLCSSCFCSDTLTESSASCWTQLWLHP